MVEARRDLHNYILARYQSASRPSGRVHVTLFAPSSRFSDASFSEGRISTAPHPNMPPMRQTKGNRSLRTGHGSNLKCSQPKMPPRSNLEASSTHDLGAYNWAYVLFRYFGQWPSLDCPSMSMSAPHCILPFDQGNLCGHPRGLAEVPNAPAFSVDQGGKGGKGGDLP